MKASNHFFIFWLSICLAVVGIGLPPTQKVEAGSSVPATDTKGVSPDQLLNKDGTLDLDGSFYGALDLENWNVQLDPALGPVFSPLAAKDNWEAVGTGGGPFNDSINSVAVNGTDIYVGGWFRDAGGVPEADYIAKWNGSEWTALSNGGSGEPALSSNVVDMLFIGSDLYVAGWFSTQDTSGSLIPNADKFAKWNGTVWSAVPGMTENLNDIADALAYDAVNNIIYIGGRFTDGNGVTSADRVFGIDLDINGTVALGSNGASDGSLNNNVYALAVDSAGNVYAGGSFTNVNNNGSVLDEADYVAKWDGTNWSNLGNSGAGVGALNSAVSAVEVDTSDNVYIGGSFTDAANIPTADFIAKWDGANWSALGSNGAGDGALWSTGSGITVQEIIVNGTDVYAGGFFIGSPAVPTADYIARFDTIGGTWSGLGSDGAGNGSLKGGVVGMAFDGSRLYLGGHFYDVNNGGSALPTADYFAQWSGASWSTLGNPDGMFNYSVDAMAVIGTDVYVGGNFSNLGGDQRIDYIARWDGSRWNPVGNLTQSYGSLNGKVEAFAVDGTDLYVGGFFTFAYNEGTWVPDAKRIAKWDGSAWSALGTGVNAAVLALAVDSNHILYAGGAFTNVNSIPEADYVAKWDGSWSSLSGNGVGDGALDGSVYTIAVHGSSVYVGGNFTNITDTTNTPIPNTTCLAKWDGFIWSAMDGITSPLNNLVYVIAVSGGDVYVGGAFNDLNGDFTADKIAKWDGSTWSSLGNNGAGGGSLNSYVNAIAVDGNHVYVGGNFTNVTNTDTTILGSADFAATWDGTNWSALGSDGSGGGSLNERVESLMIHGNDLWASGNFNNVNNNGVVVKEADYLAVYGLQNEKQQVTFKSAGSLDGWILESSETSGKGGTLNKGASTLNIGDDAANKQYRAVLSFDTSSLPDNAVITNATLKFKYAGKSGTLPFSTHSNLLVDIRTGAFSNNSTLQLGDFKAAPSKSKVLSFNSAKVNNWYSRSFNTANFQYINLNGLTQFRLRFTKDDNNDFGADFLKIYSGNAGAASRPQLIVEYYIP